MTATSELAARAVTTAGEASPPSNHVHHWDRLRMLAMLDILGLHFNGTHALAGLGLPLFHMLSLTLSVAGADPPDTAEFVRARVRRLILPWIGWSLVFAAVDTMEALRNGRSPLSWFRPAMLLYGPRIHLWFLPFVAVAGVLMHQAHRRSLAHPRLWLGGSFVLALLGLPWAPHASIGWPFEQWLFSMPSVLLGFGLGRSLRPGPRRARPALAAGVLLLGIWTLILIAIDRPTGVHVARFAGALGLLVGGLWLPDLGDPVTRSLRPLLLGTYILHPIVFEHAAEPLLWRAGLGSFPWARLTFGGVMTVFCVWTLRQTPLRRLL